MNTHFNFNRHKCMEPRLVPIINELSWSDGLRYTSAGNMIAGLLDGFYYYKLRDEITALYRDAKISRFKYKVAMYILDVCEKYPKISEEECHSINLS